MINLRWFWYLVKKKISIYFFWEIKRTSRKFFSFLFYFIFWIIFDPWKLFILIYLHTKNKSIASLFAMSTTCQRLASTIFYKERIIYVTYVRQSVNLLSIIIVICMFVWNLVYLFLLLNNSGYFFFHMIRKKKKKC